MSRFPCSLRRHRLARTLFTLWEVYHVMQQAPCEFLKILVSYSSASISLLTPALAVIAGPVLPFRCFNPASSVRLLQWIPILSSALAFIFYQRLLWKIFCAHLVSPSMALLQIVYCSLPMLRLNRLCLASLSGEKYVLMLRDDFLCYCLVYVFAETTAESSRKPIIDWCAAFGVPEMFMSNGSMC